jgi:hypothetical protein
MIKVQAIDGKTFKVTVEAGSTTTHTVILPPEYYQELTQGSVDKETLVQKSFEFLLERESNTSILRTFELPVINQYFPEYERTIRGMLEPA